MVFLGIPALEIILNCKLLQAKTDSPAKPTNMRINNRYCSFQIVVDQRVQYCISIMNESN